MLRVTYELGKEADTVCLHRQGRRRNLAQLLRADLLPEAWIAPPAVRQLRALLRHRVALVRLRTLLRNRIPRHRRRLWP
jgi:hypothetical protein